MKVIATKPGFHGTRRFEGDKFDVPDKAKASWFKPVSEVKPEDKPKGKAKDNAPETMSELARAEHEAQGEARA